MYRHQAYKSHVPILPCVRVGEKWILPTRCVQSPTFASVPMHSIPRTLLAVKLRCKTCSPCLWCFLHTVARTWTTHCTLCTCPCRTCNDPYCTIRCLLFLLDASWWKRRMRPEHNVVTRHRHWGPVWPDRGRPTNEWRSLEPRY